MLPAEDEEFPTARQPTSPAPPPWPIVEEGEDRPGLHVRLFGSRMFFRLWCAQVVSSLGDWIGFLAIAIARRPGGRRRGLGRCRRRPRDDGPHRAGLLPRAGGRGAGRPLGPQEGDGRLRRRSGVRRGDAAVRRPRVAARSSPRSSSRWARCCGRRPRRRRSRTSCPTDRLTYGQLALAGRGLRHVPVRRRCSSRCWPRSPSCSGDIDAVSTGSRPTRSRWRSSSTRSRSCSPRCIDLGASPCPVR